MLKIVRARRELRGLRAEVPRLERQRDTARRRVQGLRGRVGLLRRRLEVARGRADQLEARVAVTSERLARHESARAEGRAVEFEYPYHPQPRSFEAPDRTFFTDLLSSRDAHYVELTGRLARHLAPLASLELEEPADPIQPHWLNPWFPPLDGMMLYAMVAENNPATYLEVGSGNSTKFVRRAIEDHGLRTRVVSIDPFPRVGIDDLCDEVIRQPYEDIDRSVVDQLGRGDMMFVDNSHRSFTASDVTVFFTETLPYLRPGVLWGVHDTFLPHDYPASWNERFYNEQYLLMCYLLGGARGDQVELPVHYLELNPSLAPDVVAAWPEGLSPERFIGGAFWMRRP